MTEEEINIAIAKELGWTFITGEVDYDGESMPFTVWKLDGKDHNTIPDYCHDLNAMYEAENSLSEQEQRDYFYRQLVPMFKGREPYTHRHAAFATAHQRAEAFLRVKGLWKE